MCDAGPHDVIVIVSIISPVRAVNTVEVRDEVTDYVLIRSVAGSGGHIDGHLDHLGVFPEILFVKAAPGLPNVVTPTAVVEVPIEVEREIIGVGSREGPRRRGSSEKRQ